MSGRKNVQNESPEFLSKLAIEIDLEGCFTEGNIVCRVETVPKCRNDICEVHGYSRHAMKRTLSLTQVDIVFKPIPSSIIPVLR